MPQFQPFLSSARLPSAVRKLSIGKPASNKAPRNMSPEAPEKQSRYTIFPILKLADHKSRHDHPKFTVALPSLLNRAPKHVFSPSFKGRCAKPLHSSYYTTRKCSDFYTCQGDGLILFHGSGARPDPLAGPHQFSPTG